MTTPAPTRVTARLNVWTQIIAEAPGPGGRVRVYFACERKTIKAYGLYIPCGVVATASVALGEVLCLQHMMVRDDARCQGLGMELLEAVVSVEGKRLRAMWASDEGQALGAAYQRKYGPMEWRGPYTTEELAALGVVEVAG